MFVTELATGDIPELYKEFSDFVGESHWRNRVKQLKSEIRGNRFLKEYLQNENLIAYQLETLAVLRASQGDIRPAQIGELPIFPSMSFVVQVLSMMRASPRSLTEQLRRRIHDAFKKPEAMRALRLELTTATHFARREYKLSWPEMTGGTVDLLVEDIGPFGLEVECKSIGEDKGRKIHRREVLDFYGLLWPYIQSIARGLSTGLSAVLTLPARLPERHADRMRLAREFARAIYSGPETILGHSAARVRVNEFDAARIGDIRDGLPRKVIRNAIDDVSDTINRQAMIVGTQAGGALALTVQSAQDDTLLKYIFDTLSDSARRQFSRGCGGMFVVGLHGISGSDLLSIAQQDQDINQLPTALRLAVSRFLGGVGRDHIVGVSFLSEGSLQPRESDLDEVAGTAYYFPQRDSPNWSDEFSGIFS